MFYQPGMNTEAGREATEGQKGLFPHTYVKKYQPESGREPQHITLTVAPAISGAMG